MAVSNQLGTTERFPGITGYLFLSGDLRKYRPVSAVKPHPEGFLNYGEAAAVLEVDSSVIRGMVAQGILSAPAGNRVGPSKLVRAAEIHRFVEQYVSATVLGRRFNINGSLFARYLKESVTPLLSIPIPGKEREHARFLLRDVAAGLALAQIKPNTTHAKKLPR